MHHSHAQFTQLFWDNLGKQELGMKREFFGYRYIYPCHECKNLESTQWKNEYMNTICFDG